MHLFITVLLLLTPFFLEAKPLKANISAQSAILINADTGAILYEKQPTLPCQPGSIVKIATALYTLEKKQHVLHELITASQDAVGTISPQAKRLNPDKHPLYRLTTDGTHMSLRAGETMTLDTLLHGLMLSSGNDASNVIAEYVSGTIPRFMDELNAFIKKKGCTQTHFTNPHGLPHAKQQTTAKDMARLTQDAMKSPIFCEIVKKTQHPRPQTNKQPPSVLPTHNRLLKRGAYFYPKAIGVKTGSTDSGLNFVGAAKEGDRTLIAVVLCCEDSPARFRDAITLFEAAFAETKISRTLLSKDHEHFTLSLKGAKALLEGGLAEDVTISYYPAEEPHLKALLHWDDKLKLPILQGQKVGEIRLLTKEDQIFKSVPIFAKQNIDLTLLESCKTALKERKSLFLFLFGLALIASALMLIKKKVEKET